MQRRLTAGKLQYVRDAFQLNVAIYHARVGGEVQVSSTRPRFREAHRTMEIATRCDLDQRDTGVLFVFGTQPTVIGTAALGFSAVSAWKAFWLAQLMPVVVGDI